MVETIVSREGRKARMPRIAPSGRTTLVEEERYLGAAQTDLADCAFIAGAFVLHPAGVELLVAGFDLGGNLLGLRTHAEDGLPGDYRHAIGPRFEGDAFENGRSANKHTAGRDL